MKRISVRDLEFLEKVAKIEIVFLVLQSIAGTACVVSGMIFMANDSLWLGFGLVLGGIIETLISLFCIKVVFIMFNNQIALSYEVHHIYNTIMQSDDKDDEESVFCNE